jgi:Zn-dependent protease
MVSLGRVFGVPIYFAPSWLLIAVLLTVFYGPVIEGAVVGVSSSTAYLAAFGYAVVFALCVLVHELGHTAVSIVLGKPVRRIVIFFLGGVSEIEREPDRPRDEFLIAVAGPLTSAALAGVALLGARSFSDHSLAGVVCALLCWGNLIVAVFNLLPGLPLDGGRVLRSVVWAVAHSRLTGTRAGALTGRVVAVLVAVSGLLLDRGSGSTGFTAALVTFAMAAYLWVGAGQTLKVAELMERVPTVDLGQLLRPGLFVPNDISIAEGMRRIWSGRARGLVLVDAHDRPSAIVDEARLSAVPVEQRPWTRLIDVARPMEAGLVLPDRLGGDELLAAMRATPANEYLVVRPDGSPAGILATVDLANALKNGPVLPSGAVSP